MNEKLNELKAELAKLADAVVALLEENCKEEKHGFKEGQQYWYVSFTDRIFRTYWENSEADHNALTTNTVFHTKEEAEQRLEYLKAEATLRRFMKGKPKGSFVPYCSASYGRFDWANAISVYCPKFLYSDKETIEQLIATHERELKIYFEVAND